MANVSVSNTFTAGTSISSSQMNTNFNDLVTYINNRNSGSSSWDNVAVAGTLTVTGASTFTGGIANLFGYRKPNLSFASITAVDVENNTGTSNQTTIIFPDGTIRSVTEDTSSTNKYRRFLITATAEFLTGTEDSGLYTGLSEATNTWYAIYAVKSQINAANFVLVGTTTLPIQANFATLNSNLGSNSWIYLGMIRNGDNDGATGDIVTFLAGNGFTKFRNNTSTGDLCGLLLASNSGTTGLTYTYASGTGAAQIPVILKHGIVQFFTDPSSSTASYVIDDGTGASLSTLALDSTIIASTRQSHFTHLTSNVSVSAGGNGTQAITLAAFFDPILGGGINPII